MANNSCTFAERKASAQKAAATRKRNKYEEKRNEAIQSARREYLYNELTDEQHDAIDQQLDSATADFDGELEEFIDNKAFEVMEDIRILLRKGIHPAVILNALEVGNCEAEISTGRGGFTIDKQQLLTEVLVEEEFHSVDTCVDTDEVPGMDESEHGIPPALEDEKNMPGFIA